MKKILLITVGVFSLLSSFMVAAQTFTVAADTVWVTTTGAGGQYHDDITNISSQPINIRWNVLPGYSLPQSWQDNFGICDNMLCRNNPVGTHTLFETVYTTMNTPYPVGGPTLFDIQLTSPGMDTAVNGSGFLTINIRDITNTTGTSKNITFMINKFPTSVNKVAKGNDDVTLYPNPARNELNVLFNPDADIKIISVYNLIGKAVTVYKLTSNTSAKLNIEDMPTGIYFIRLINGQGQVVATRKFTHQ